MLFGTRSITLFGFHTRITNQNTLKVEIIIVNDVRVIVFLQNSSRKISYLSASIPMTRQVKVILFVGRETSEKGSKSFYYIKCEDIVCYWVLEIYRSL